MYSQTSLLRSSIICSTSTFKLLIQSIWRNTCVQANQCFYHNPCTFSQLVLLQYAMSQTVYFSHCNKETFAVASHALSISIAASKCVVKRANQHYCKQTYCFTNCLHPICIAASHAFYNQSTLLQTYIVTIDAFSTNHIAEHICCYISQSAPL